MSSKVIAEVISGSQGIFGNQLLTRNASISVSGSIGSLDDPAERGISVFGGDTFISGALHVSRSIILGHTSQPSLLQTFDGLNALLLDGDNFLDLKSDVATRMYINGGAGSNRKALTLFQLAGVIINDDAESDMNFRAETGGPNPKTHALYVSAGTDQVLVLSGGGPTSYNEAAATDVNFYVSGTIGGKHRHTGVSIFGGDLVASGTIFSENGLRVDGPEVVFFKENTPGTDTNWFVSGSVGGKGSTNTATFGGDVFISGAIYHENPLPIHTVNTGYGDIVTIGNSSVTAGKLYYYKDTGWTEVDAADVADGASQLLGIALGTNSHHGMIVRGFAQLNITGLSSGDEGKPVYVDKTGGGGTGKITVTPPAAAGDFVRLLGWLTDDGDGGSDASIYFSPSNDWIEVS